MRILGEGVRELQDVAGIFSEYEGCPIALYGLGIQTEETITSLDRKFQIVGLMDSFRRDGVIYGKPIISLSEAAEKKIKLIIVVARPGSCRAIARNIGGFCVENHIKLFDVRGKDLCAQNNACYDLTNADGTTKRQLMEEVLKYNVISIDLFDTLVMRKVLLPTDIIELVEYNLKGKGICLQGFCERRLQAEKELSKYTAPTLEEIYQYMLERFCQPKVTAKELAELEWNIDYALIVPRREMVEFLSEIFVKGKKVYIVTDTFYKKEQLIKVLEKCGIAGYTDIIASCEYKVSKAQGLFENLKNIVCGQDSFHIGDDLTADIESARRFGISACRIYSGIDMLELTGYLGLWNHMNTISSRIKIGLFVARMFNSPFQFESEGRKLVIKDAYDIGYLLLAPVISDFVIWFHQQVKDIRAENVWLGARDGYLIKKLYDILIPDNKAVYFLTSRTASVRAGIADEADLAYIEGMKFSGTLQQQMKQRFGITVEEEAEKDGSLFDFSEQILDRALVYKQNYQTYIRSLDLKEGNIAFLDFVAKGTTQMHLSRLVEQPIKGIYFLQLEKEFMRDKKLDIRSFYENGELHSNVIYENYYILETILTSPWPSILGFDENGRVLYAEELRSEGDIDCFLKVQDGITAYFENYLRICPELDKGIDKELDEVFVELIHKLVILDPSFLDLKVEDPFFNRMTNIIDLI